MPRVTIHTPTWNRAATLPRAWESLKSQTFGDFEWIVSDDASNDGTLELLEEWQAQASFDLRIRVFPRRVGKPFHDNDAARVARGELFVTLGSDDAFVPTGLERLVAAWDSIPISQRSRYASVTAQTVTLEGEPVGVPFPASPFDVGEFELAHDKGLHFDAYVMVRTDLLRGFPYPEIDYVVPESSVWLHTPGRRYMTRCINEVVTRIARSTPNRISGYPKMRYNRGYAYGQAQVINNPAVRLWRRPGQALARYLNLGRLSRHGQTSYREVAGWLRSGPARFTFAALYPAAMALAVRDRLLGKVEHTPFTPFSGEPIAIEPKGMR